MSVPGRQPSPDRSSLLGLAAAAARRQPRLAKAWMHAGLRGCT